MDKVTCVDMGNVFVGVAVDMPVGDDCAEGTREGGVVQLCGYSLLVADTGYEKEEEEE